jgi:SAM-dependent methyltransferase
MTEKPVYIGKDLEAMSFAVNYHRWILDEFRPYLGDHIVEVGAGTGNFSRLLLAESPRALSLVEPSEMFAHLERNISRIETKTEVSLYHSIFRNAADTIAANTRPDTIIYINVLEHIEDDLGELQAIRHTLAEGGRCLIFVPALRALYGDFDRKVGHFRRYAKRELEEKCRTAGFDIVRSGYFDLAGIIPWFIKYRILRSDDLSPSAVTLYDKLAVPIVKRVESLIKAPLGKNVLTVIRKGRKTD